jgi:hypothetical protein
MKRRDFLSLCGSAAGSCLIPEAVARVIRDVCVAAGKPHLDTPPNPRLILSAIAMEQGADTSYLLTIGDPRVMPEPISLLGYLGQFERVDITNSEEVRRFCCRHYGEPEGETWHEFLSHPVTGMLRVRWELWWETTRCPSVIAHRLLRDLPLDDGNGAPSHEPLANLVFNEGPWHGPQRDYIEAGNLAALACLQHRLNKLDQNIAIRIEDW